MCHPAVPAPALLNDIQRAVWSVNADMPLAAVRTLQEIYSKSAGKALKMRVYKFVSPGLLDAMGNKLVAGRDFTWVDAFDLRPVAMVSESLARELWREPSAAIGKQIRERLNSPWREVVGVVADEREDGVDQPAPAIAYWPIPARDFAGNPVFAESSMIYVVR